MQTFEYFPSDFSEGIFLLGHYKRGFIYAMIIHMGTTSLKSALKEYYNFTDRQISEIIKNNDRRDLESLIEFKRSQATGL